MKTIIKLPLTQLIHTLFAKSIVLFLLILSLNAQAAFITYNGGSPEETAWQTAAGSTLLENFQSYSSGTQVSTMDSIGLEFGQLAGGGYPVTYSYGGSPHGAMEIANFPNGINETNRWDDFIINVMPEYVVTAFGFWNSDGNGSTLVATAYDAAGNNLGSISSYRGTFAGFISDVAVSQIVINGNTGDGWNHMDGLQTNANEVSLPGTLLLFSLGFGLLLRRKIK